MMKHMLIKDYMEDYWIEEVEEPKFIETKGHHNPCPLCDGTPSLQEQIVYHGRGNHKGACIWLYLRNVICTKCRLQTGKILYAYEYDDSDTVYPTKKYASDSDVWKDWNALTEK